LKTNGLIDSSLFNKLVDSVHKHGLNNSDHFNKRVASVHKISLKFNSLASINHDNLNCGLFLTPSYNIAFIMLKRCEGA